jgi:hypothetical protein
LPIYPIPSNPSLEKNRITNIGDICSRHFIGIYSHRAFGCCMISIPAPPARMQLVTLLVWMSLLTTMMTELLWARFGSNQCC